MASPENFNQAQLGRYIRFGDWPADERSMNHIEGWKESGVSAYEADKHGNPVNPDPDFELAHDPHESMMDRMQRARRAHMTGDDSPTERGHIVSGEMIGMGADYEPLIRNVQRLGSWPGDREKFWGGK